MILKLPRDFRCYNCYRRLRELLEFDDRLTLAVFMELWTQLGYQVDVHGRSGRIGVSEREYFDNAVHHPGAFVALLESQTIIPINEDEYFCPIFEQSNEELDRDFIPDMVKARSHAKFLQKVKKHSVKAFDYMVKMKPECWLLEDGVTKIIEMDMNRSILLIKLIDNLIGQDRRAFSFYSPPLIQSAHTIIRAWSDDRLLVVLRRLYAARGTLKDLPRTTADVLRRFEDLVWKVMPDEGYIKWGVPVIQRKLP